MKFPVGLKLASGPLAAVVVGMLVSGSMDSTAALTAAVASWCIVWWVYEAVPIPVTSLLPLALFPLLNVLDASQVAAAYGSPLIILMLGGFILSCGMSATGTHQRLAVSMLHACARINGVASNCTLVAGFMLASALLSMWISNTATTLMLLPIALAILEKNKNPALPMILMLGIAYAANIGGIGTPIGTPPNLIFLEVYAENTGERMGFLQWMRWGVPVVILFIPLAFFWLVRDLSDSQEHELPAIGKWSLAEKRVMWVFGLTALLWVTRGEPYGGWSALLGLEKANDASIALLAAIALFVVPNGKGERLLNWEQASQIPWGMLLLFAGGICIAKAFVVSGLSAQLGGFFSSLTHWHIALLTLVICLGVSFLTETTSNTATTTLLMPIFAAAAMGAKIPPEIIMAPAAMSASCAFMLPVATAPNAIVFGSGYVDITKMLKMGFVLNIVGAVLITAVFQLIG